MFKPLMQAADRLFSVVCKTFVIRSDFDDERIELLMLSPLGILNQCKCICRRQLSFFLVGLGHFTLYRLTGSLSFSIGSNSL